MFIGIFHVGRLFILKGAESLICTQINVMVAVNEDIGGPNGLMRVSVLVQERHCIS